MFDMKPRSSRLKHVIRTFVNTMYRRCGRRQCWLTSLQSEHCIDWAGSQCFVITADFHTEAETSRLHHVIVIIVHRLYRRFGRRRCWRANASKGQWNGIGSGTRWDRVGRWEAELTRLRNTKANQFLPAATAGRHQIDLLRFSTVLLNLLLITPLESAVHDASNAGCMSLLWHLLKLMPLLKGITNRSRFSNCHSKDIQPALLAESELTLQVDGMV